MNIITKPSVYLVGKQELNSLDCAEFLEAHGVEYWNSDTDNASEHLVEIAGRLCYMSFAKPRPGGNKAYIDHILEVGHGSVLEHAVYSMIFTGVSRSLTHELVRHRAGMSYSQLSQRYVDESDCAFVVPPSITLESESGAWWASCVGRALGQYQAMIESLEMRFADITDKTLKRKKIRETARAVLPNCTETKIFVTGNARAWRHFLELRGSIHADAEIQRLAIAVLDVLQAESPNLFGDYTVTDQGIETKWRKV
jgi:thymidylate synthase (FAD)